MDNHRELWGGPANRDASGTYGSSAVDEREDDIPPDTPPIPVGQDERRMQVRAYNHWVGLLGTRALPAIADLDPERLPGFATHAAVLDFSQDRNDPAITYLGANLAADLAREGGTTDEVRRLSDVPEHSLLSCIAERAWQSLANPAPIGFDGELPDRHGGTIVYRGVLLPFSGDDRTISHLLGVINWRELADQRTTDQLLHEIGRALTDATGPLSARPEASPESPALSAWADGPASLPPHEDAHEDSSCDSLFDLANHPALSANGAWPGPALASHLRRLTPLPLAGLAAEGREFTLLLARRTGTGMVVLGEVGDDGGLITDASSTVQPPA